MTLQAGPVSPSAASSAPQLSAGGEARALLTLATPLIGAQLAAIALGVTDVIMMGWLGADALAAGAVAHAVLFPAMLFGMGVVSAAAPMVAQALGAGDATSVRRSFRQSLWVALILSAALVAAFGSARAAAAALGQPTALIEPIGAYVDYARWLFPGALAFFALRAFLSAHEMTAAVLWATVLAAILNAIGNYAFIFGHFGAPAMGLAGAGLTTALAHGAMALALGLYALTRPQFRPYALLVRFFRPDWPRFFEIWRIGLPIGLMIFAEAGLFAGAAILMGWLGAVEVAAHAIALNLASVTFMIPLGLSQAGTIRVGLAYGKRDAAGVARAGWATVALSAAFMLTAALVFLAAPHQLARLFLAPTDAEARLALALAAEFILVAAVFQLFDGAQAAAAGALRGMSDTGWPMAIALGAYWLLGLPTAYVCGFWFGWGGVGVWIGLAVGLAVAATALNLRFWRRSRALALRP